MSDDLACATDGCEYVAPSPDALAIHRANTHHTVTETDRCGECPPRDGDPIVRAIHRVRGHDDDPGDPLYGTHPDAIEATIREAETIADAGAALEVRGERVLRLIGALGLGHLVTPDACGVAWDSEGRVGGAADD